MKLYLSWLQKSFLNTLAFTWRERFFSISAFSATLFYELSSALRNVSITRWEIAFIAIASISLTLLVCVGRLASSSELNLPAINFNGFGLLSANIVQIITIILRSLCKHNINNPPCPRSMARWEGKQKTSHPSYKRRPNVMLINLIKHAAPAKRQLNEPTRVWGI